MSLGKGLSMSYRDQCLRIVTDEPSYDLVRLTYIEDNYSKMFDRSIERGLDHHAGL